MTLKMLLSCERNLKSKTQLLTVILNFSLLGCLSQPHQFPDQPVAHFDAAHQHQQVKDQLADVVPHDGGRRQGAVRDNCWCGGESGEDHAGQNHDTAFQTDGVVAFQKRDADTAGGLSRETGQRDGRDGGGHVELEKAGVNG